MNNNNSDKGNSLIYAVDFDGTLHSGNYPTIGQPNVELISHLLMQQSKGHKIVLWTCREGKLLDDAVDWCKNFGLVFDAVNDNVDFMIDAFGGSNPRKIFANVYIDDRAWKPNLHKPAIKHFQVSSECEIF